MPRLAMLFERPGRLHDLSDVVKLGGLELSDGFSGILAVELFREGLVVEGVDMRGATIHVEEDDVFGFGRVVGLLGSKGIRRDYSPLFLQNYSLRGEQREQQPQIHRRTG